MPKQWAFKLCIPLASAAVLIACKQEVGTGAQDRTAIDGPITHQQEKRQIAVTGCLGVGSGTQHFVLTHVEPVPLSEQPTDALSAMNYSLPKNSAVRLTLNDDQEVGDLVGQTVRVTGLLTDTGADTIGTAGLSPVAEEQPESRDDKSQAATDQHHAEKVRQEAGPIGQDAVNNGTYPEMRVQRINGTGKSCTS
jgi:hypothetical protein